MAWFKVDDGFHHSAKVLSIPRDIRAEALGAWIIAGTWSADNMTDGFIPTGVLFDWPISGKATEALTTAGLWILVDGGVQFHDWCEYQPTREQLESKSKVRAEAGARGGRRSAETRRSKSEANAKQNEANVNPEPEPVPEPLKPLTAPDGADVQKGRKSKLTTDWYPDNELITASLAIAPRLNVQFERDRFIDYYLSKGRISGDWSATWRNWVRNQVKWDPSLALPLAPEKKTFRGEDDV
jgi:hypothetical protein